MTRQEYLAELSTHLMSLPSEERENAVRFYEEYFDDAGVENEQSVMDDLGKPFALAKSIICEQSAYSKSMSYAKYRESKSIAVSSPFVSNEPVDMAEDIMPSSQPASNPVSQQDSAPHQETPQQETPHTQYTAYDYSYTQQPKEEAAADTNSNSTYEQYKEAYKAPEAAQENVSYTQTATKHSEGDTVIFVLGLLLGIFFIFPALLTLICVFAALLLGAVGAAIGSVFLFIAGIIALFGSVGTGILFFGAGLVVVGIGFLIAAPAILGLFKFTPWTFKMFGKFFKRFAGGEA